MATVFISPSKYVQGAGEMNRIGSYVEKLGKKALCIISKGGQKRHGEQIRSSFDSSGADAVFEIFSGECSYTEIHRIEKIVKENACDVVVGIGGGKIFDTAKAVAYYCGIPVAVVPTVASTDAPCSALSVIYTDEGVFQEFCSACTHALPKASIITAAMIVVISLRITFTSSRIRCRQLHITE